MSRFIIRKTAYKRYYKIYLVVGSLFRSKLILTKITEVISLKDTVTESKAGPKFSSNMLKSWNFFNFSCTNVKWILLDQLKYFAKILDVGLHDSTDIKFLVTVVLGRQNVQNYPSSMYHISLEREIFRIWIGCFKSPRYWRFFM